MRRPSFPTVIAMIALFVALGGTSYAVIKLPPRSVGNRELKSNAVTASKIRNGSIAPEDLSAPAARGPRGPEGPAGGTASGTGTIPPAAAWQPLLFAGVWTNYGSGYGSAAFRADQLGTVHVRGLVTKNGAVPADGDVIGTLPAGYRPKARVIFIVRTGGTAQSRVDVLTNGNIVWIDGGVAERDYTSLDSISFSTD